MQPNEENKLDAVKAFTLLNKLYAHQNGITLGKIVIEKRKVREKE